jgi:hypothetical protein
MWEYRLRSFLWIIFSRGGVFPNCNSLIYRLTLFSTWSPDPWSRRNSFKHACPCCDSASAAIYLGKTHLSGLFIISRRWVWIMGPSSPFVKARWESRVRLQSLRFRPARSSERFRRRTIWSNWHSRNLNRITSVPRAGVALWPTHVDLLLSSMSKTRPALEMFELFDFDYIACGRWTVIIMSQLWIRSLRLHNDSNNHCTRTPPVRPWLKGCDHNDAIHWMAGHLSFSCEVGKSPPRCRCFLRWALSSEREPWVSILYNYISRCLSLWNEFYGALTVDQLRCKL